MDISPEEMEICLDVLQRIAEDPACVNGQERFKGLVAKIHREGKKGVRQNAREESRAADRALYENAALVRAQRGQRNPPPAIPETESPGALRRALRCYVCKRPFTEVHFFYHRLCPECAAFNYAKRMQRADLTGRVALVTGGRIKIGYQTALRLLRDGARVIVTTRFPEDAARRFHAEPDAAEWRERLVLYGLDLRNLPAVEAFVRHLDRTEPSLDILIHNAAQTIKRPLDFYRHLLSGERETYLLEAQPRYSGHLPAALCSPGGLLPDIFDADGQPLDKRGSNSWALRLDEVGALEMLEVQLVNSVAPFLLNGQLKPLLMRSPFERRFIINVSAMEGQFYRASKTVFHPHTNMAKAALNMMTRTAAADYARDGIYMNSVDTGWITDEKPYERAQRHRERHGFYPPLDVIDGMARLYDPIVQGLTNPEEPVHGCFLKDYAPHAW